MEKASRGSGSATHFKMDWETLGRTKPGALGLQNPGVEGLVAEMRANE